MATVREEKIYAWRDGLSLEDWSDSLREFERGLRVALVVGTDWKERVCGDLARKGWVLRSLQDVAGRSGVVLRADKP